MIILHKLLCNNKPLVTATTDQVNDFSVMHLIISFHYAVTCDNAFEHYIYEVPMHLQSNLCSNHDVALNQYHCT